MLTENIRYEQDVRGEFCFINEITISEILRDGVVVSSSKHRGVVTPGTFNGTTYTRTDVTGYSTAFQAIAGVLWDDSLHSRYEQHLRNG